MCTHEWGVSAQQGDHDHLQDNSPPRSTRTHAPVLGSHVWNDSKWSWYVCTRGGAEVGCSRKTATEPKKRTYDTVGERKWVPERSRATLHGRTFPESCAVTAEMRSPVGSDQKMSPALALQVATYFAVLPRLMATCEMGLPPMERCADTSKQKQKQSSLEAPKTTQPTTQRLQGRCSRVRR